MPTSVTKVGAVAYAPGSVLEDAPLRTRLEPSACEGQPRRAAGPGGRHRGPGRDPAPRRTAAHGIRHRRGHGGPRHTSPFESDRKGVSHGEGFVEHRESLLDLLGRGG